jgi:hypothetical protein
VGYRAGEGNTGGIYNTYIGGQAGSLNNGNSNVAIGLNAMLSSTSASANVAVGQSALNACTTGANNTAIGVNSGITISTGDGNSVIGANSSADLSAGYFNSAFGYNTGRGITTGSNNTILGSNVTGLAAGLSNTVIIADGSGLKRIVSDANESITLGKASLATTATDGFVYIPTCAGVPTGTPTAKTGFAPLVIDSTNNKMYCYAGGAWRILN